MKEKTVERWLQGYANKHGCLSAKLVASYRGFPDQTILAPGGKIGFAECKEPGGGVVDPLQSLWIEVLRSLGFKAAVVSNNDEAKAFVDSILGEK